jgi:LPXTG-motif cell wall-anchored protein
VALAMLGTAVPAANADTNPGIIDPSRTVYLNVYKYLGSPTTLPNNGTQQDVADSTHLALSGVKFDAYKVYTDEALTLPVDLTTNAGWEAAADITGYPVTKTDITNGYFDIGLTRYYLGAPTSSVTDDTGLADFSWATGTGLYLVNEDLAGSGTIQKCTADPTPVCTTVDKTQVSPVYPFFVTLPMTNPDDLNSWMYTVYAYPKNQQATGTKAVADKNTQTNETTTTPPDDSMTFTISTPITDGMTAAEMKMYQVIDDLDARLTYSSLTVAIDGDGDGNPATGTQTPLTEGSGADYTVAFDPNSTTAGAKITVSLTSTGLGKLVTANTSNAAATVLTTITATITGTEGDGSIENMASFIPNQAFYDSHAGVGTNTNGVTSYYGDLRITKVDPKTSGANMSGAEFAVYIDPTPALGSATNTCSASDVDSTQTAVATGTTDSGGLLTIGGLQTSDWYNGASQTDLIYYCLVETKAPTGYNLLAQPISFKILKSGDSSPAYYELTVKNQKKNLGNALPLTGGQGVAVMSIGGALLVGAGLASYLVYSRRHRNAQ